MKNYDLTVVKKIRFALIFLSKIRFNIHDYQFYSITITNKHLR